MLNDRLTARILGAVVLLMTLAIDLGSFFFSKPELRQRPTFPLVILIPSLPLFGLAFWLFRRASKLKE